MSAGSNSKGSHRNSLAQRAERSAGRLSDHTNLREGETFHEKKPVAGAFGQKGNNPDVIFEESPESEEQQRPGQ